MEVNNKSDFRLNIKQWAEEDRPREKLLLKGVASLSDAELVAILIGSGNKNETAVELSQRILSTANNNLNTLGKLSINDLVKNFNGIGEAKAITIVAALELGRRRKLAEAEIHPKIQSSKKVYDLLHPLLADLKHEEFWIILLNKSNTVLKKTLIGKGTMDSIIIDIKMIFKEAIENLASGLIICHNHPTNECQPSRKDDELTYKIKNAATLLDITLHDHVIICDGSYYSYRDESRL